MGWFKRLCLFVYGLAGILALVALALPWVGPYTEEATSLIYVPEYFRALEVVVGITGVGCLVCLLRAIFTPRNYKNIIITSDAGDQITVTRSAIASQAQHIVERDGSCTAGTIRVHAKKRGSIRVFVRVTPKHPLDVVEKGRQLQAELDEGLAKIAADKVKGVNLEFTDPEEMDDGEGVTVPASAVEEPYDSSYVSYGSYEPAASDAATPEPQGLAAGDGDNGITVSMSSFHRDEPPQGLSHEGDASVVGSEPAEQGAEGFTSAEESDDPASSYAAPASVADDAVGGADPSPESGTDAPANGEGDE